MYNILNPKAPLIRSLAVFGLAFMCCTTIHANESSTLKQKTSALIKSLTSTLKQTEENVHTQANASMLMPEILETPSSQDLVGYWERLPVPYEIADMYVGDPTPYPYEWFKIDENGNYQTIASDRFERFKIKNLVKVFNKAGEIEGYDQHNMKFEYVNGFMLVNAQDAPSQQVWLVTKAKKAGRTQGFKVEKDDLLLTLVDGKALRERHLEPITVRHLRKLASSKHSKESIDI